MFRPQSPPGSRLRTESSSRSPGRSALVRPAACSSALGPIEVMGELQFRYLGGLSDVDWLVEEGLKDINAESERWSVPFVLGARFRFLDPSSHIRGTGPGDRPRRCQLTFESCC